MPSKMWFGNLRHAQWVPMPKTGMTRTAEGSENEIVLDNGGLWIDDTAATHWAYTMEFPVRDRGYEGIEAFQRYQRGEWGTVAQLGRLGYLRFVDPMYQRDNLFAPSWASPGIYDQTDWKALYDAVPTFSDTLPSIYQFPLRQARYSVTGSVGDLPTRPNSVHSFIIPPGHKLCVGATGARTGSGVVRVSGLNAAGIRMFAADIIPSVVTNGPTFSVEISGDDYPSAQVYLTRTAISLSSVTLSALRAQIIPIGETPVADRHKPGQGHMGLKMRSGSRVDTYVQAGRKLVSASLSLAEVEPWAP